MGTRTWALASEGADLAAAIQTILERGKQPIGDAVDDAFPGSRLSVRVHDGLFELALEQAGMLRPMRAAELSAGTLGHLLWLAPWPG